MSAPAGRPSGSGLPRGVNIAAVLCLILSGLTGMSSCTEAANLSHLSELREQSPTVTVFGDPAVLKRVFEAQLSALEPMREPRALILGSLAVACALIFVAAGRMLRPAGLPREGMRRLLGGAAIAAAILRTLDGAQWMVVVKRASTTMADAMSTLPEFRDIPIDQLKTTLHFVLGAATVAQTAFIAGAFVLLGQYFHSERVRQAVTAQDGPTE
ncbi:MAG: hypothetical protein JXB05_01290 [Myxococcaceae bacterium]|nr:hypothetical protein [Myxococcaceae bacterium]